VLVQAVVSAEDKDFYKHPGFSFLALARAAAVDAISGKKAPRRFDHQRSRW